MEADDLDNLIADSLGGVQSALDAERKATAPAAAASNGANAASGEWAKEAVRDLQSGPGRSDGTGSGGGLADEAFFASLVKTFQDENFQKAMADAMQATDAAPAVKADTAAKSAPSATPAPAAAAGGATSSSGTSAPAADPGSEEFLQNFLQSFDKAVGSDTNFEKSLSTLMTSMLSNDLICEPLKEIADRLEPWLKSQKGLPQTERKRYEDQLRLYKHILGIYRTRPDPLPEDAREEVQRHLAELQLLGQPPEEIMKQIQPKEAEEGGENFEDFMKSMGLNDSLGSAEQDLLKKLSEDPEELTKVMKDMAEGLPEEACKQQ